MPPGRQICPPCVCPLNSRSKSRSRGLPVNFGRVGQKDRKVFVRNRIRRFLDIVHSVKVGVVDPRQMNQMPDVFDDNTIIEQHSYPHRLQIGDHADRIVITQNII